MRIVTCLFVAAAAVAVPARTVMGQPGHNWLSSLQNVQMISSGKSLYLPMDDRTSEALKRPARLSVSGVRLEEALIALHRESELPLLFSPELIPDVLVRCDCSDVTVEAALDNLLANTDLEYLVSSTQVIVAPRSTPAPHTVHLASTISPTRSLTTLSPVVRREKRQQGVVAGLIVDQSTGAPIANAQVSIRGTSIATLTNAAGRFTLQGVPVGTHTVVVHYIGYQTLESAVTVTEGGTVTLNLSLVSEAIALDELVVVGYGTQQKREVTGSVASIRADEIATVPVASFENALQGRLAGVNVAEASGEPGAAPQLFIRGVGSISAGGEPLYVVDGVPYSTNVELQGRIGQQNAAFGESRVNPLASINPNDIESIEVLKDAAASAIYGSRGSNGVVLITTKKGNFNTPAEITVRTYTGIQTAFNKPQMMNAREQIEYITHSRNNAYLISRDPLNPASPYYNPLYDPNTNAGRAEYGASGTEMIPEAFVNWDGTDTDWIGAVLNPAVMHDVSVSVRGGGSDLAYFVSGNYLRQNGVIKGSSYERYALKFNLGANVTGRLRTDLDVNLTVGDHDRKQAHAPYFGTPPGIIYSAMVASPAVKIRGEDGEYLQAGETSINGLGNGMTTSNHPLAARDYIDDKLQTGRIVGAVSGTYSFSNSFRYKMLMGYDFDLNRRHFFQGTKLQYRGNLEPQPYAQSSTGDSYSWLWENTLSYDGSIGSNHRFSTVVGYTAQRQFSETSFVIARNFPDDQVKTINGGQIAGGGQTQSEWTIASMLGRVNYTLMDRYMATLTVRSDRSSRFGWDNQTGVFPSISAGWEVTREPFMRNVYLVSQLKPRISYGITGNFNIPNYGAIGLIDSNNYVLGEGVVPGVAPVTLGNKRLTWETTGQLNMGLDWGVFNDRFYGSLDYYISNTKDLLLNVNVPSSSGFATALMNMGKVQNKGVEAQVSSRNLVGAFQWTTDFNISTNSNVVKQLGPEGAPILSEGAAGVRHITRVGGEVGAYYGYVHDGIYKTQADLDNAPVDLEGNVTLGDIRFKDINGDGVIDANDRTEIGSYNPDFLWGLTNRFSWGQMELSVFFQGVSGRQILNLTRRHMTGEGNFNLYRNLVGKYWKSPEEPGDGWNPKPDRNSHGGGERPSTYQIEDGSYVSLKTISLGYNLPRGLPGGFGSRARVFASVNNVFMWTKYWGWNPEASIRTDSLTPGQDYGAYPLMRAFQFGVDVTL